ncbi:MAG: hypothetical protein N2490_00520 [Ignavibacteria bacterium]|nr:hypothetical protein [Ignavibacteria bacterium]
MDYHHKLYKLFENYFGEEPTEVYDLVGGASKRKIVRLKSHHNNCIGIHNEDVKENIAFCEFTKTFKNNGFKVPEILFIDEELKDYLEEDLGDVTLFSYSILEKSRYKLLELYIKALSDLIEFQFKGIKIIDFDLCYQTKYFDLQQIILDEKKFLEDYLKIFRNDLYDEFSINDFSDLNNKLIEQKDYYFMYRDFQPRNIMIFNGENYYIDYQSGRKGPLQYDIASFLYSSSIIINDEEREYLLENYMSLLDRRDISKRTFFEYYYHFALIRIIQMLGSYALIYTNTGDNYQIERIKKGLSNLNSVINELPKSTLTFKLKKLFN